MTAQAKRSHAGEDRAATQEDLVQRLVRQLDRTFIAEGRGRGLEAVAALLRQVDRATLEAMAVDRELDAEEPEREE